MRDPETTSIDYRFLSYDAEQDFDTLQHEPIPVAIDHEQEEISIGIAVPDAEAGYATTLDSDWDDRVPYLSPLASEEEAWRRLPELGFIQNSEVQDRVVDVLLNDFREDYWHKPASTSGNHHPWDERWQHGQWIHTKRVITTAYRTMTNANRMKSNTVDDEAVDHTVEAAFYHDLHKFGRDRELDTTYGSHAVTAAIHFEDHPRHDVPEPVARGIERHTGPQLYDGAPEPECVEEYLLHAADATSALYGTEQLLVDPAPELRFAQAKTRLQSRFQEDADVLSYTVMPRDPVQCR